MLTVDLLLARRLARRKSVPRDTLTATDALDPTIPQEELPEPLPPTTRGLGGFIASRIAYAGQVGQQMRAQAEQERLQQEAMAAQAAQQQQAQEWAGREMGIQQQQARNVSMGEDVARLQGMVTQRDQAAAKEAEEVEQVAGDQLGAALQQVVDTHAPPEPASQPSTSGDLFERLVSVMEEGLAQRRGAPAATFADRAAPPEVPTPLPEVPDPYQAAAQELGRPLRQPEMDYIKVAEQRKADIAEFQLSEQLVPPRGAVVSEAVGRAVEAAPGAALEVAEIVDRPRRWVKEKAIEPTMGLVPGPVEVLKKAGLPDEIAVPLGAFMAGPAAPAELIPENIQAEAASLVVDPLNAAFFPAKTVQAVRAAIRVSPKLAAAVRVAGRSPTVRRAGTALRAAAVGEEAGFAKIPGEVGKGAEEAFTLKHPTIAGIRRAYAKGRSAVTRAEQSALGDFADEGELARLTAGYVQEELGGDPAIRLYRGLRPGAAGPGLGEAVSRELGIKGPGDWWTTDLARARRYAGDTGQVFTVEARASELANPDLVGRLRSGTARADVEVAFLTDDVPRRAQLLRPLARGEAGEEAAEAAAKAVPDLPSEAARPAERGAAAVEASTARDPAAVSEAAKLTEGAQDTATPARLKQTASDSGLPPPPRHPVAQAYSDLPPENPEGILASLLDRPPEEDFARSMWRKYVGGRQEEAVQMRVAYNEAKALQRQLGIREGAKRTADSEAFVYALHAEEGGRVPEGWQPLLDLLQGRKGLHESRLLASDPGFKRKMIPDYWPRQFRGKSFFDRIRGRLRPGDKPGFLRPRKYESLREALDNGEKLATWDPVDQWFRREIEGVEYIHTRLVADAWKNEARALPRSVVPENWRTPPYRAFESRPYVTKEGTVGWTEALGVSPEDYKVLRNIFGDPLAEADVVDALATLASVSKRLKVLGGLFQMVDLSMRTTARSAVRLATGHPREAGRLMAAVPRSWYRMVSPAARAHGTERRAASPILRLGREEGLQEAGGLDIMRRTLNDAITSAEQQWRFGGIEGIPGGKRVNDAVQFVNGGLYDALHPELVDAMFESIYLEIRVAAPELTARQAAARGAEVTNIVMSAIPEWQSLLGPRWRQFARAVFFSPNETEAWFRQVSRAVAGPNAAIFREQWVGYALTTFAFAEIINLAFTGKPLDGSQLLPIMIEEEGGVAGTGLGPNVSFNTRFMRPRLTGDGPAGKLGIWATSDGRDKFLDLLGQADTPLRWLLAPSFALRSRLSAPVNISWGLAKSEHPFYETPIETLPERGLFAAREFGMPIPAAGFMEERERIGTWGSALQAAGFNVSAEALRDLRNRTAEADPDFGQPYDKLARQGKLDYRAQHPEHFLPSEQFIEGSPERRAAELREDRVSRMAALAERYVKDKDGRAYADGRGEILQEIANRLSEIPRDAYKLETPQAEALDVYFRSIEEARQATPTGLLQGEEFGEVLDRVEKEMGPEQWALVQEELLASGDPVEREFLADRAHIRESGYWDVKDLVYKEVGLPTPAAIRQKVAAVVLQEAGGLTDAQQSDLIQQLAGEMAGEANELVATLRDEIRNANPELLSLLVKWGYYRAGEEERRILWGQPETQAPVPAGEPALIHRP